VRYHGGGGYGARGAGAVPGGPHGRVEEWQSRRVAESNNVAEKRGRSVARSG
jgi:hypothetical protein